MINESVMSCSGGSALKGFFEFTFNIGVRTGSFANGSSRSTSVCQGKYSCYISWLFSSTCFRSNTCRKVVQLAVPVPHLNRRYRAIQFKNIEKVHIITRMLVVRK